MRYKVHRLGASERTIQEKLESFLNELHGEVVAILPYVRTTFQMMGATSKVGFVLVVEKTDQPG